jgi:hypothetical protein
LVWVLPGVRISDRGDKPDLSSFAKVFHHAPDRNRDSTFQAFEKPNNLSNGGGLRIPLIITSNGGMLWRGKYSWDAVEELMAPGLYPEIALAGTHQRRDTVRKD